MNPSVIDVINGFGTIVATPDSEYLDSSIANPFNQAATTLNNILNGTFSTPQDYFNAVITVQVQLEIMQNLASNGITTNVGNGLVTTLYLPQNLALVLDVIVRSLQAAGINLNSTPIDPQAAIQNWQNMKGFGVARALTDAIGNSGSVAISSLQSMIELQYVKDGNDILSQTLTTLNNALESSNSVIKNLNQLQNQMNQVSIQPSGSGDVNAIPDLMPGTLGTGLTAALQTINFPPLSDADFYLHAANDVQNVYNQLLYSPAPQNPPTPMDQVEATVQLAIKQISDKFSSLAAGLQAAWTTDKANALIVAQNATFTPSLTLQTMPVRYLIGQNLLAQQISAAMFVGDNGSPQYIVNPDAATNQALFTLLTNNNTIAINQYNTSFSLAPTSLAQISPVNLVAAVPVLFGTLEVNQPPYNEQVLSGISSAISDMSSALNQYILNNGYESTPTEMLAFLQQAASQETTLISSAMSLTTNYYNSLTGATLQGSFFSQLYTALSSGYVSSFATGSPIPIVTATTIPNMLALISNLQEEYNKLVAAGIHPDEAGSLTNSLQNVLNDLQPILDATTPSDQLQAIINWMMDAQNKAASTQQSLIQGNISQATSVAQSLNDSQKQNVNYYMYIFQSFYQSASNALSQLTRAINSVGDGMAS